MARRTGPLKPDDLCARPTRLRARTVWPDRISLLVAAIALAIVFALLAFVDPPAGVVERNVREDIDATPLFYTESDRLPELEAALKDSNRASATPGQVSPLDTGSTSSRSR